MDGLVKYGGPAVLWFPLVTTLPVSTDDNILHYMEQFKTVSERMLCVRSVIRRCHHNCGDSCYGPGEAECCSLRCVGGCSGPARTQCYVRRSLLL